MCPLCLCRVGSYTDQSTYQQVANQASRKLVKDAWEATCGGDRLAVEQRLTDYLVKYTKDNGLDKSRHINRDDCEAIAKETIACFEDFLTHYVGGFRDGES